MAAKKTTKGKKPSSAADFRIKEEADKRKMKRTDAQGRSGMGASKPQKSKNQEFWDSFGGKTLIATNSFLTAGAVISAAERAARKKIKGKKWAGDPGLKPGE